jgi:hypothetical protein
VPLAVGVPESSPLDERVSPGGSPVAEKEYEPPDPPLAVNCTGVIATPSSAFNVTQPVVTGGATVIEQLSVPLFPLLSVIVTV